MLDLRTSHHQSSAARGVHTNLVALQWIWVPLSIYAVGRVVGALLLAWASRFQAATPIIAFDDTAENYFVFEAHSADPGYSGVVTNWDGQWYQFIATDGYQPADSALDPVAARAWAFPPLYPKIVGALMRLSGWDFHTAGTAVSLVFGAIAMVLIYRMAQPRAGDLGAAGLVAVVNCFVTAPLLQVTYSESLGLAITCWALLHVGRGQYWWAIIPVTLLAFTRIITPPLALVALVSWACRRRSGGLDRPQHKTAGLVALMLVALTGAYYWSLSSGFARGTYENDRAMSVASGLSINYFAFFGAVSPVAVLIPTCVAGVAILTAWSQRRFWGVEMATWAAFYPLFVLAVTPPTTGLLRYLLLAFPFGLLFVGTPLTPRPRRIALIIIGCAFFLVLQVVWVRYSFLPPVEGSPVFMP